MFAKVLDFLRSAINLSPSTEIDDPEMPRASTFSRVIAWIIDFCIIAVPRLAFAIIANIFIEQYRIDFVQDIIDKYGGFFVFSTIGVKAQVEFFFSSKYGIAVSILFIIFVLISFFYNIIMLTSSWGCTYGQRLATIKIVKDSNYQNIGMFDAIVRTLFSYTPWVLPFVMFGMWNIFLPLSILSLILLAFWYDLSLLLSAKRALHDIISGTTVIYIKNNKEKLKLFI